MKRFHTRYGETLPRAVEYQDDVIEITVTSQRISKRIRSYSRKFTEKIQKNKQQIFPFYDITVSKNCTLKEKLAHPKIHEIKVN